MVKIFLSHKSGDYNNQVADRLRDYLTGERFDVFLDRDALHAGDNWMQSIFDNITDSDVLVVLLTRDANSRWVQREIDYARGCRVRILPVVLDDDDTRSGDDGQPTVADVQQDLELANVQYTHAYPRTHGDSDSAFGTIVKAINERLDQTDIQQEHFIQAIHGKWRRARENNPDLQPPSTPQPHSRYKYFLDDITAHACTIYLTVGDMTKMRDIPVLVNSENAYMQMQRVFAPGVSKAIRVAGAKGRGNNIYEDTIQHELNAEVFKPVESYRTPQIPVAVGDVFLTSSGHERSDLRRRGFRYILHVAVLDCDLNGEKPVSDPEDVRLCVTNCLEHFDSIDDPDPPASLVFPVLGTGNGKLEVSEAMENMAQGVIAYLDDHPDPVSTRLQAIHIMAYTPRDAGDADRVLKQRFKKL